MKRISIFSALLSVLFLAGCFHNTERPEVSKNAVVPEQEVKTSVPAKAGPSAEDQNLLLQARLSGKTEFCAKIQDGELKTKCESDIKSLPIPK